MTLLRLLTSKAVMAEEVLKPREAWELYRKLRRDWRVSFSAEPAGLEGLWLELMNHPNAGTSWTDAYLAAFALGQAFVLASFDRGFSRWTRLMRLLLTP
jgi:predicted nucleic acid-binding protein